MVWYSTIWYGKDMDATKGLPRPPNVPLLRALWSVTWYLGSLKV